MDLQNHGENDHNSHIIDEDTGQSSDTDVLYKNNQSIVNSDSIFEDEEALENLCKDIYFAIRSDLDDMRKVILACALEENDLSTSRSLKTFVNTVICNLICQIDLLSEIQSEYTMKSNNIEELHQAASNYRRIRQYLYERQAQDGVDSSDQRTSTRTKLTLMSVRQFLELSTDVRDEVDRRCMKENENEYPGDDKPPRPELAAVPFLPIQKELHHQRNQGRQKLAKLPNICFKDLASDVLYELDRRYPQLRIEEYRNKSQDQTSVDMALGRAYSRDIGHGSNDNTSLAISTKSDLQQQSVIANSTSLKTQNTYDTDVEDQMYSPKNSTKSDLKQSHAICLNPSRSLSQEMYLTEGKGIINSETGSGLTVPDPNCSSNIPKYDVRQNDSKQKPQFVAEICEEIEKIRNTVASLDEQAAAQKKVNPNITDMVYRIEAEVRSMHEKYQILDEGHRITLATMESLKSQFSDLTEVTNALKTKTLALEEQVNNIEKQLTLNREVDSKLQISQGDKHNLQKPQHKNYMFAQSELAKSPNSMDQFTLEADNSLINKNRIRSYRDAVHSVLDASRSEQPNNILMAMKSIVVSCRKIIENVEEIEESPEALKLAIPVTEIEVTKAKVMKLLTHLMSVAKKCASRPSSLDMDSIKLAITELTKIVQVLIFQVVPRSQKNGISTSHNTNTGTKSAPPDDTAVTRTKLPRDSVKSSGKSVAELKTEMIVKALHALLSEMRSSKAIGPDFSQTLGSIIFTVENLISVFRESIAQPYMAELRHRGETCLSDFSNAKLKFKEAGSAVMQDPLSNVNRRQLASSSYHIAKDSCKLDPAMSQKVFGLLVGYRGAVTKILASETDLSSLSFFQRFSAGEALNFFTKTIIERTQPGSKAKIKESSFVGHILIKPDGLAAVLVTEDNYPIRTAFSILENTLREFVSKFPDKESWADMTPDKIRGSYPELAEHLKLSKDPQKADPFFRIQKDLDETIGVVNKTFESLIERGEKLDDLVGKSEELSTSSKAFYAAAKKTNSCC